MVRLNEIEQQRIIYFIVHYDDVMIVATFDVTFMCSVTVCFSSDLSTREDMSKSEKKWTNGLDELRTGHKRLKCCMRHTDRY